MGKGSNAAMKGSGGGADTALPYRSWAMYQSTSQSIIAVCCLNG